MKLKIMMALVGLVCHTQQVYADQMSECINALDRDLTLQPISDKVSLTGKTDRLFSMMTNESYPTASEKEAIFAWATRRERCLKRVS